LNFRIIRVAVIYARLMRTSPMSRFAVGLLLATCTLAHAAAQGAGETAIHATLADGSHPNIDRWDVQRWRDSVLALYAARQFTPLWFADRQLTTPGASLLHTIYGGRNRGPNRSQAAITDRSRCIGGLDSLGELRERLMVDARRGCIYLCQTYSGFSLRGPESEFLCSEC
jgi:hypothetical protein